MNIVGIIPARMSSTRFPGKPLAKIRGIPMVGHVYYRTKLSKLLNDVYIATCDKEIRDYAISIGAKAVMTKNTHQRATDRAAEAMLKIERETNRKIDIVVMIQGDEPMIIPRMIDLSVKPMLTRKDIFAVNLMGKINSRDNPEDPNLVKVVTDNEGFALYFSREAIPSQKKQSEKVQRYKQIPIIPFTRASLLEFNRLRPTRCEKIESVDMLRILEHGYKVKMVYSPYDTCSVDNAYELRKVEKMMRGDPLTRKYVL